MIKLQCRNCGTVTLWQGGAPGPCGNCGRQLIPVTFELTSRLCIFAMMCVTFWMARDLPSGSGTPLTILFAYALAGAGFELLLFLGFRMFGRRLPTLYAILLAAFIVFPPSRLVPGAAAYFFGAFLIFRLIAGPLALIPLEK